MSDLRSNRDLYRAIEELIADNEACVRSLEDYLCALLGEAEALATRPSLTLDEFYGVIARALTSPPLAFDEAWRKQYDELPRKAQGFEGWRATIIRQIVDQHEMEENGTLADKFRYFGLDSPRDTRWYNFDPLGYIESATAGAFGGWEHGETSLREFVPGRVAVLKDNGSLTDANPRDIHRPEVDMPVISWEQFEDFIFCGQIYE